MKFEKQEEEESLVRTKADKELEVELKRIKFMRKMGWHKGRMIV